jgi:hypothetical protein
MHSAANRIAPEKQAPVGSAKRIPGGLGKSLAFFCLAALAASISPSPANSGELPKTIRRRIDYQEAASFRIFRPGIRGDTLILETRSLDSSNFFYYPFGEYSGPGV